MESDTMRLDVGELRLLLSIMNEVMECIDDWEFQTRVGVTKVVVLSLQAKLEILEAKMREVEK